MSWILVTTATATGEERRWGTFRDRAAAIRAGEKVRDMHGRTFRVRAEEFDLSSEPDLLDLNAHLRPWQGPVTVGTTHAPEPKPSSGQSVHAIPTGFETNRRRH